MITRGVAMKIMAFIVVALLTAHTFGAEPLENESTAGSKARAKSPDDASKAITIPLDQIWAYEMPGTQDVRELEPKPKMAATIDELARHSDVYTILKVLGERPKESETANPAFVVVGTGRVALKNASAVFTSLKTKKNPPSVFPPDKELSLVFYSHPGGRYVRLVSVEESPLLITLKYQPIRRVQQLTTRHFALIPLGKLSKGTYVVKIVQLKSVDQGGHPVAPQREPQRFVSGSFSFTVQKH